MRDVAGNPVPGASVSIVGTNEIFECGPNGQFQLKYSNAEAIIRAESKGYVPSVTPANESMGHVQVVLQKQP